MGITLPLSRGILDSVPTARETVDPLTLLLEGPGALEGVVEGPVTGVSAFLLDPTGRLAVRASTGGHTAVRREGAAVRADADTPFATIPADEGGPDSRRGALAAGHGHGDGTVTLWHPEPRAAVALAEGANAAMLIGRTRDGVVHVAVRVADPVERPGITWANLRWCAHLLPDDESALACEAVALVQWHRQASFCQHCGARVETTSAGWTTTCPACGTIEYPRQDPAVIMAVVDEEDRVLLAHNSAWRPGFWSVLAGFVEAGEAPDRAVRREVLEEVGLEVGEVRFLGAQPWPFPRSLMVGYAARLAPGAVPEVHVDGVEIDRARFFTREELGEEISAGRLEPPGPTAIARAMVEEWYGGPLPESPRRIDPLRQA